MLIRDLGNCGNIQKLQRILAAINVAIENQCELIIVLDPLVYGKKAVFVHRYDELRRFQTSVERGDIHIGKSCYHWWDIVKCNVIF